MRARFPKHKEIREEMWGTRLAGHDTQPGAPSASATQGDSGLAGALHLPVVRPLCQCRLVRATREPAPSAPPPPPPPPGGYTPASGPWPCRLPEGAWPPPFPVVRQRRLARSSSPRRVREREAVTFGESPTQGTGPRAAPASSHSCSALQGTRPKARPAGPLWREAQGERQGTLSVSRCSPSSYSRHLKWRPQRRR